MKVNQSFNWTKYYMAFADQLLQYKNKRKDLLSIIKDVFDEIDIRYPLVEDGQPIEDVCPFTVFGTFNKRIKNNNRIAILRGIGSKLGVQEEIPSDFGGIPVLNNMKAWFFGGKLTRENDDIPNLWDMFEVALEHADQPSDLTKGQFIACYDRVIKQRGIKWNLTMALYWIRPYSYLNLDEINRNYLSLQNHSGFDRLTNISDYKEPPSGSTYLELIDHCKEIFNTSNALHSFPHLSYLAWLDTSTERHQDDNEDEGLNFERDRSEVRSWIYSPGRSSSKWDEFYKQGIMGIGWNEMGDLKQYPTKDAMKKRMKELYGEEFTYMNSAHATWQFANELLVGDIVYAKKGRSKVIGRGVVESNYIFDPSRKEYMHIHRVKWTHRGEWEHPGHAVLKTLTDITMYTDYVEKLEALFYDENIDDMEHETKEIKYKDYTETQFLNEVFIDKERYETLKNLLESKRNLILQGAPGVGKTFAAKRLAYSIMGKEDTSRVMMIQFHQSYSYEDFIMGYRPKEDGFELEYGPFYRFCKKAQDDDERKYFFIIDEINRGNLSKIFGELLMLIEADKRSEKLRLLYKNELFSVPENVFIIGMMNTADRSLAMIDYALRRRFAFFELEPAFDSDGFKRMMDNAANPKLNALVAQVKALNEFISNDESLGAGFRIGHSYFCTKSKASDEWLRSIVNYELIPLLNEYWFDEPAKVDEWTRKLSGALHD